MEGEKVNSFDNMNIDDDVLLPGFRFHPTDEELVGFYLRRKVDKRPLSIELIKQIDIYKYDPWDLPISSIGEKEMYFFCILERKYRNSVRPNRVTVSGFWKATGIDRPIYSGGEMKDVCIGLKKSLVYYGGSAGKGTKTDWMMHEFRLPATAEGSNSILTSPKNSPEEAEILTLCRIFKRNVSYRRYAPGWREPSSIKQAPSDTNSQTCNLKFVNKNKSLRPSVEKRKESKPLFNQVDERAHARFSQQLSSMNSTSFTPPVYSNNISFDSGNEFMRNENWDELGTMVAFASDPSLLYSYK